MNDKIGCGTILIGIILLILGFAYAAKVGAMGFIMTIVFLCIARVMIPIFYGILQFFFLGWLVQAIAWVIWCSLVAEFFKWLGVTLSWSFGSIILVIVMAIVLFFPFILQAAYEQQQQNKS